MSVHAAQTPTNVDDILRILEAERPASVSRGKTASQEDTTKAARALDLTIPEDYVAFAESVGHLAGPGWHVFGMGHDERFPRSAAGATVLARLASPDFPHDLLVIGELGADRLACLDCGLSPTRGGVLDVRVTELDVPARLLAETLVGYVGDRLRDAPAPSGPGAVEHEFGLVTPPELAAAWEVQLPPELAVRVFRPLPGSEPPSLQYAFGVLAQAAQPPRGELLPLHLVDARSLACVVCARPGEEPPAAFGWVVRWHLDDVPRRAQSRLLDLDVLRYIKAAARTDEALPQGKRKLAKAVKKYAEEHGNTTHPRAHVYRPIRLACQNVLVGEAVWAHDARFDGLNVRVWHSSQEPHVNAHEGTRALTAMMLAEAFRGGGTMEVRFDRHAEHLVPAALAQWARTAGLDVDDDQPALEPAVARELMLAATEMPTQLRNRVSELAAHGGLSVERACYTLLAGIWKPIELDFLLASSPRALDILRGGTHPLNRARHQAELDLCRAASMLGTLLARLQQPRGASVTESGSATAVEDERTPISWTVLADHGAVRFSGIEHEMPWLPEPVRSSNGTLTVLPRSLPTDQDCPTAGELADDAGVVALLTPQDVEELTGPPVPHMRHPDRRSALDRGIEANLLASRVGRR
jgi:hypothetical protein